MSDDDDSVTWGKDGPLWGTHAEYEQAFAVLLANLSSRHLQLPAPNFWSIEKYSQRVRAAVRDYAGLALDDWDELSPPERVPWLELANEVLTAPDKGRVPGVLPQVDVAKLLDTNEVQIGRLVKAGKLKAIKAGRSVRITLDSLQRYRREQK